MNFDFLFLGYGKIVFEIISKFIAQGYRICLISDIARSEISINEFHSISKDITILGWEDAVELSINAKTTVISWRSWSRISGLGVTKWLKSNNFQTNKIINLSSSSVYTLPQNEYFEKDFIPHKSTSINSKQLLEKKLIDLFYQKNVVLLNLRISNVYGENLKYGFINESILNIMNKVPIKAYQELNPIRDFLYIQDLIFALSELSELTLQSNNINLSTGIGVDIKKIINLFRNYYSHEMLIENLEAPTGIVKSSVLNCDLLKSLISWSPRCLDFTLPQLLSRS